ncbi:ribonuclease P protein component [Epilithonimonas zeae]|uniref:ribonuclease P protein component n=1 Tax=Epilithonimonas zeae TaxID=1416779 RepID=UPI0020104C9B|nr:ribonuclease P protein component [Epilithonimonas zeae]UQB68051.1 ribonuclease P protein component [Epilithonimonas zeae]
MDTNSYPSHEKLKKKYEIDLLFAKGKWLSVDNVRIIHLKSSDKLSIDNHKIGVSVSKKFFKRAVDRNRIKRLLRESYRLNKSVYINAFGDRSIAMLFWASKELPGSFSVVEKQFLDLCKKRTG